MIRRDFLKGALLAAFTALVPDIVVPAPMQSDTTTQIEPDVEWTPDPIYVTYVVRKNGRIVMEKRDIRK